MNALLEQCLIFNFYILIAGLLSLGLRLVIKKYANSQRLIYSIWQWFPLGFVLIFLLQIINIKMVLTQNYLYVQLDKLVVIHQNSTQSVNCLQVLIIVWLLVGFLKAMHIVFKYIQFKKHVHLIHSPMAFGFLPARLHLPEQFMRQLSNNQQELIIEHEQTHCDRHDPLLKMFYNILTAIFWFNPMTYIIKSVMKIDQELSCDQVVIEKTNKNKEYANLLLKINQLQTDKTNQLTELYCSSSSKLKERIMSIYNETQSKKIVKNKSLVLISILATLVTTSVFAVTMVSKNIDEVNAPSPPKPDEPQPAKYVAFSVDKPISPPKPDQAPQPPKIDLKVVKSVAPYYPRQAAVNKIHGYVDVQFDVMKNGDVENVVVINANPKTIFNQQAINAMKQYKFAPIASKVKASQRVEFKLD